MQAAVNKILDKTKAVAEGEADEMLLVWVIYHLQIIGEAAYKISDEFKKAHPDVAWSKMIGMRHILIHGYFQTDTGLIWNTVEQSLPPLKVQLEELLRS